MATKSLQALTAADPSARNLVALKKWRHLLLLAMLGLLLAILWSGPSNELARALFVTHFGLFIVWQPFVEGGRRLTPALLGLLLIALVGLSIALGPRLLLVWIVLLTAVVGGKVMLGEGRSGRVFYLLALGFLVLSLLLLAVPQAFPQLRLPEDVMTASRFGLVILLGLMAVIPRPEPAAHTAEFVDFVNSVLVLLLLSVTVLGSLALVLLGGVAYLDALIQVLLWLGGALLVLGWLWNPHAGFSGIGELLSRYMMSMGLPAEQWLQILADHATRETDPVHFLTKAIADMNERLPWLKGAHWETPEANGMIGREAKARAVFRHLDVVLTVHTAQALSPSLAWHLQLLTQLLGEFYADKVRARQLKELSYLQAVHETGARLTHDVKNLLQSMQTLCHLAESDPSDDPRGLQSLLRRQLPALAGRLTTTLSKLQRSELADDTGPTSANTWWAGLGGRFGGLTWLRFQALDISPSLTLPEDLFSTALENLVANIEEKRAVESSVTGTVELLIVSGGAGLRVSDNGSAVPDRLLARLLQGPVESANGLGIGLYQVARAAQRAGYRLRLESNRPGKVCFSLMPEVSGGQSG